MDVYFVLSLVLYVGWVDVSLCIPKIFLYNYDLVVWCKLRAYGEGSHCSQDTKETKAGEYEFKSRLWNMKSYIKEIKYKVKQTSKQQPHTHHKYSDY